MLDKLFYLPSIARKVRCHGNKRVRAPPIWPQILLMLIFWLRLQDSQKPMLLICIFFLFLISRVNGILEYCLFTWTCKTSFTYQDQCTNHNEPKTSLHITCVWKSPRWCWCDAIKKAQVGSKLHLWITSLCIRRNANKGKSDHMICEYRIKDKVKGSQVD